MQTLMTRYGKCELIRELGRGSFSIAYLARLTKSNAHVCVKIFHPRFDKTSFYKAWKEAALVSQFNHYNIIRIFDIGEFRGTFYMMVEYMKDGSLADELAKKDFIDLPKAISIITQISSALEAIHSKGIVHRDVKPSNILLAGERAVLSDFGIAKALDTQLSTEVVQVRGTVIYMSPEQAMGKKATPRSDLYALGIVLYEMLTGRVPFKGENIYATIWQKIHQDPPFPTNVNPSIPKNIEKVILKAIARDPRARYRSCKEFSYALLLAAGAKIGVTVERPRASESLRDLLTEELVKAVFAVLVLIVAALILWFVFRLPLP